MNVVVAVADEIRNPIPNGLPLPPEAEVMMMMVVAREAVAKEVVVTMIPGVAGPTRTLAVIPVRILLFAEAEHHQKFAIAGAASHVASAAVLPLFASGVFCFPYRVFRRTESMALHASKTHSHSVTPLPRHHSHRFRLWHTSA